MFNSTTLEELAYFGMHDIQIIGTVLKRSHGVEENLDPQALLYKNLWLEAEATLCTMKYQASAVRMKTGMVDYKSKRT